MLARDGFVTIDGHAVYLGDRARTNTAESEAWARKAGFNGKGNIGAYEAEARARHDEEEVTTKVKAAMERHGDYLKAIEDPETKALFDRHSAAAKKRAEAQDLDKGSVPAHEMTFADFLAQKWEHRGDYLYSEHGHKIHAPAGGGLSVRRLIEHEHRDRVARAERMRMSETDADRLDAAKKEYHEAMQAHRPASANEKHWTDEDRASAARFAAASANLKRIGRSSVQALDGEITTLARIAAIENDALFAKALEDFTKATE